MAVSGVNIYKKSWANPSFPELTTKLKKKALVSQKKLNTIKYPIITSQAIHLSRNHLKTVKNGQQKRRVCIYNIHST